MSVPRESSSSPEAALRDTLLSPEFSGVISVVHGGRALIDHVAGLANRDRGSRIEPSTRFATASVSKMFTAVCVARLVEEGLCRFDQRLTDIVPRSESHFGPEVTLASLLAHRSGLGDYLDDDSPLPFHDLEVEKLDRLGAFLPLVLQAPRFPADEFRYSSAGYVLLGLAIEAVTGRPFAEAIRHRVTEPAGLASTGFPHADRWPDDVALGYLPDGRPNRGHLPPVGGPDGGVVTGVGDLRRFFAALEHGDLITDGSRRFLWHEVSRMGERQTYGHGFMIDARCGEKWVGHTGSDPGVSAKAAFSRQSDSTVIVLCNCDSLAFRAFRQTMDWLEEVGLPPDRTLQLTGDARES